MRPMEERSIKTVYTMSLTHSLIDEVDQYCKEIEMPRSHYIERALRNQLQRDQQSKNKKK